jgi:hypothetical protein
MCQSRSPSAAILDAALEHTSRFRDHRLSLADCASFEVIQRLGLPGLPLAPPHPSGYIGTNTLKPIHTRRERPPT